MIYIEVLSIYNSYFQACTNGFYPTEYEAIQRADKE